MLFYLLGILKPIGSRAGGVFCTGNSFNIFKMVCISSSKFFDPITPIPKPVEALVLSCEHDQQYA
jgi:hypothetical protein